MLAFLTRRVGAVSKRTRIRPAAPRHAALGVLSLEDRSVPSATAAAFALSDVRIEASPAARDAMVRDVGAVDDLVINAVISGRGASAGQGGGGVGKVSMNDIWFVPVSTHSHHSGGVNAVLVDGSVRFLSNALPTFTFFGAPPPKADAAVDHPFALIGGKGAVMSLGGVNSWSGTLTLDTTAPIGASGGGVGKVHMQDIHFAPALDALGRTVLGTDQGVWRASNGPATTGSAFATLTVDGSVHVSSDSGNTPTALDATSPKASAGTTVQNGDDTFHVVRAAGGNGHVKG
jgi:hypothetical protein